MKSWKVRKKCNCDVVKKLLYNNKWRSYQNSSFISPELRHSIPLMCAVYQARLWGLSGGFYINHVGLTFLWKLSETLYFCPGSQTINYHNVLTVQLPTLIRGNDRKMRQQQPDREGLVIGITFFKKEKHFIPHVHQISHHFKPPSNFSNKIKLNQT